MPVIKSAKVIKVDCSTGEATSLEVSCSPFPYYIILIHINFK